MPAAKLKQSKTVIIQLPKPLLQKFPHQKPIIKLQPPKPPSSASPPAAIVKESPPSTTVPTPEVQAEVVNDASANLQVPTDSRKKGGVKSGTKRPLSALADGQVKPRAKPGPKKRKIEGVMNGDEANRPWTTPAPAAGHKLGPKANQGAINAGLRALDRSGKPCRKWEKKGFTVKSFTGITWGLPSWSAPKTAEGENKGESGTSDSPISTGEIQPAPDSSNVGSETSRNAPVESQPAALSPAPVALST